MNEWKVKDLVSFIDFFSSFLKGVEDCAVQDEVLVLNLTSFVLSFDSGQFGDSCKIHVFGGLDVEKIRTDGNYLLKWFGSVEEHLWSTYVILLIPDHLLPAFVSILRDSDGLDDIDLYLCSVNSEGVYDVEAAHSVGYLLSFLPAFSRILSLCEVESVTILDTSLLQSILAQFDAPENGDGSVSVPGGVYQKLLEMIGSSNVDLGS